MDTLIKKGILTEDEAKQIEAETAAEQTNTMSSMPISKWKMSDSIKSMQLFGDLRFRYEYRGVDNAPVQRRTLIIASGFVMLCVLAFAVIFLDDFSYGIRLETSNNPRSPWDTFGNNTTSGSVTHPTRIRAASISVRPIWLASGRLV